MWQHCMWQAFQMPTSKKQTEEKVQEPSSKEKYQKQIEQGEMLQIC